MIQKFYIATGIAIILLILAILPIYAQNKTLYLRICEENYPHDFCPESEGSNFSDQQLLYYSYQKEYDIKLAKYYYNQAVKSENVGENENAKQLYLRAIREFPALAEAYINLAGVLICLEEYDRALLFLEKVLTITPDYHAIVYNNMGLSYQGKGDFKKAEYYFKLALNLKADLALAHNNLAKLYLEAKQYDLAIDQIKVVAKLSPGLLPENILQKVSGKQY
jgi:tetratricopeptide (TPR) repeat protein